MKNRITIVLLCLFFSPMILADDALTPEQIEQMVANRQQEIENYYDIQIFEVTLRAQKNLSQLEIDDSLIYKSLEVQTRSAELVLEKAASQYRLEFLSELHSRIKTWNIHQPYYIIERSSKTVENYIKRFVDAKSKINELKTEIIAKRDADVLALDIQRQHALTIGLDEYRKQLKSPPVAVEKEKPKNVVTGLLYSDDKPTAFLNDKIIHVGDELPDNIKIKAINADTVEFEKGDNNWSQAVGEKPGKYW